MLPPFIGISTIKWLIPGVNTNTSNNPVEAPQAIQSLPYTFPALENIECSLET